MILRNLKKMFREIEINVLRKGIKINENFYR